MINWFWYSYLLPLLIATLPLLVWLVFFLTKDWEKPEPMRWIALTLLLGMFAAFITISIEYTFTEKINHLIPYLAQSLVKRNVTGLLLVSLIEEISKFVVVCLVLKWNKHFDEYIDAMIYMIVAAIGFSIIENYLAVLAQLKSSLVFTLPLQLIVVRFLGANLLHIICSGLIGFFWSKSLQYKGWKFLGLGFVLAIAIHTLFNYSLLTAMFYFLPFTLLFVFICATILLWMFDIVERRE